MKKDIVVCIALFLTLNLSNVFAFQNDFQDKRNGTVYDASTGLTWQQGEGGKNTWHNAKSYCDKLQLAGYSDWRLPERIELITLTEYSIFRDSIDKSVFHNASHRPYWTSTPHPVSTSWVWNVPFTIGYNWDWNRSNQWNVRCVRGKMKKQKQNTQKPALFVDNGNGTVTEQTSNLTWLTEKNTSKYVWYDAVSYCKNIFHLDKMDWRLPSKEELESIADRNSVYPAVNKGFFPHIQSKFYWASTEFNSNSPGYKAFPSVKPDEVAWAMEFTFGELHPINKNYRAYLLCVRSNE